jgi:hypothetical protein
MQIVVDRPQIVWLLASGCVLPASVTNLFSSIAWVMRARRGDVCELPLDVNTNIRPVSASTNDEDLLSSFPLAILFIARLGSQHARGA